MEMTTASKRSKSTGFRAKVTTRTITVLAAAAAAAVVVVAGQVMMRCQRGGGI